ncbi:MAG TPA: universal stress protein [Ktedonobacteraceae bacterium]|nr:universal stress protein [Ktedonobacteraceae bacterium]
MFQRILVPLDGSERAEQAIPLAARLARASGGSLFFVRVVETLHTVRLSTPLPTADLQEIEEHERAEAMDYLTEKTAASEFAGIKMHRAVISGSTPSALLQIVQQEHIDLIVLCSHGYTGFKRWALGSVAQKVIRQSPVPVLLLREQHLNLKDKVVQPVRAAIALDGSPFAKAALLPAAHLVAALSSPAQGELLLLQVVEMPTEREERACQQRRLDVDLRQAISRAADDSLQAARMNLLRELSGEPLAHIAWSVIEDGDIAHALIQAAEEGKGTGIQQPSDVLALTTHGRGGMQRWVLGSVTERVLQGSTLPLLVVHAPEAWSSSVAE